MTRPIKQIVTPWERFKRMTVWHPINTDPADENRWGPRFWYPSYDVIAITLGFYAYFIGSPLLNRLFSPWFTDAMGSALVIAATMCLFGVVFPRLSTIELLGKLALVFLLGAYAGTVLFKSNITEPNGFVVLVLIMAVWLLGPRISVLFVQVPKTWAKRRAKRQRR